MCPQKCIKIGRTGVQNSGRFVKQELWKRWRAKSKLVYGSKHRERLQGSGGITPGNFFRLYMHIPTI